MKKVLLISGAVTISIAVFVSGILVGNYLYNYDVLCEREFAAYKLKEHFVSQEGISLPAGTIVYARNCKPNISARLNFYIDNWNRQNLGKMESTSSNVYYLDVTRDNHQP